MKYRKLVTHYDIEYLLKIFSVIIIIIRHSLLELFQNVIGVRFLRQSVEWASEYVSTYIRST